MFPSGARRSGFLSKKAGKAPNRGNDPELAQVTEWKILTLLNRTIESGTMLRKAILPLTKGICDTLYFPHRLGAISGYTRWQVVMPRLEGERWWTIARGSLLVEVRNNTRCDGVGEVSENYQQCLSMY